MQCGKRTGLWTLWGVEVMVFLVLKVRECSVPGRQQGGWEATEEYIQLGKLPMQPHPVSHEALLLFVLSL